MDRKEIEKQFAKLYFDIDCLHIISEDCFLALWEDLEEDPDNHFLIETLQDIRGLMFEVIYAASLLKSGVIEEALDDMFLHDGDKMKTLANWREKTGNIMTDQE